MDILDGWKEVQEGGGCDHRRYVDGNCYERKAHKYRRGE